MEPMRRYGRDDTADRRTDGVLHVAFPPRKGPEFLRERDPETVQSGRQVYDLVHQISDSIKDNDARTAKLLQRAIDELSAAEARIQQLETRVVQAEARANEAEKWLKVLHDEIQDKLATRNDNYLSIAARFANP